MYRCYFPVNSVKIPPELRLRNTFLRDSIKTLRIMRHAKSDYPPDVRSDFDRHLNEQGRKDVPLLGKFLNNFGPQPDAVSASPALRARQTVEGLATTLNVPTNTLRFHESLYLALPQTLAQAAATFPDSVQTGLLFAHNPGLEEWVAQLTGARVELPTAGLVAIQLGCFSWTDIEQKYGQLLYFIIPLLIRAITQ